MPVPAEDDVRAVLADFHRRLRLVIDRAWSEWMDSGLGGRLIFARAKSDVVFDFIARHALAEFGDDDEIHVLAKRATVQFLFKDTVLLRFKKGNAKGIGANIETQAVLDFIDPERHLFELPDILKVEVCYQPDRLGTQVKEVAVVARDRNKRIWAYELEAERGADIVPFPPRPSPAPTPPTVAPKKPAEDTDAGE
jgi:hypothetical protein